MIAEVFPYKKAVALTKALEDAGINANITVGGISIDPRLSQVSQARQICRRFGAYIDDGNTTLLQQMTTIRAKGEANGKTR